MGTAKMKNENDKSSGVEDSASKFRRECEEVTVRFAGYPAVFLEFMGFEFYEQARDALKKKKVSSRVLTLLDGALLMLVAAEQAKCGKLDPLTGMGVAEQLPELTKALVAEGWRG
jgi:hypothetical protein